MLAPSTSSAKEIMGLREGLGTLIPDKSIAIIIGSYFNKS